MAPTAIFLAYADDSDAVSRRLRHLADQAASAGLSARFLTWPKDTGQTRRVLRQTIGERMEALWFAPTAKTCIVALAAKAVRPRLRLIVDVGDLNLQLYRWTFGRIPFRVRLGHWLERAVWSVASTIVARGTRLGSHVPARYGPKMVFIPDCAHPPIEAHQWSEHETVIGSLGTIVWSDRLQWGYGFDLVEVLSRLPDDYSGLVIGDGPGLGRLRQFAAERGVIHRISFTGRVRGTELDTVMRSAGIYVMTPPGLPPFDVRTTGKLPELLARRHPVICTAVGSARDLLEPALLVEPWPQRSWQEVYDDVATRVRRIRSDVATRLPDERTFSYASYAPVVEAALRGSRRR